MSIAPPIYVGPTSPEPARFGLFSVANMLGSPEGERWEFGVEREPFACGAAGLASHNCDNSVADGYPLTILSGVGTEESQPFLVYGSYGCSSASRPIEDAEARARAHLLLGEERAVERAIAAGSVGVSPSFSGATDLTPVGGPVPLSIGMGLLEAHLGEGYGGLGVIHAPRSVAALMQGIGVASREGQRLETLVGNFVVAGSGYNLAGNVSPAGVAPSPDTAWLYVTSRPWVRRSEVTVIPEEDHFLKRGTNDVEIIAQRVYLVGWDCVTAAVNVDLTVSV